MARPSFEITADERQARLDAIARRCRIAFLAGAEEESIRAIGRALTEDEQRGVLDRYPGDWVTRLDRRARRG